MTGLENFQKEKKTIALAKVNVYGFLLLTPILLIYLVPFYILWKQKLTLEAFNNLFVNFGITTGLLTGLIILLVVILGVVIHEVIHGVTWAIFAKNGFRSIRFGVLKEMLTPYCHCQEPLKLRQYMLGAIMPGLVMGILPWLISLLLGNVPLLLFGTFRLIYQEDKQSYVGSSIRGWLLCVLAN